MSVNGRPPSVDTRWLARLSEEVAFKRLTSGASAGERAALFHDTAQRFYRL